MAANGDFDIDHYKAVGKSRDFTGKVVLVTGSSSGIGEGIVKLFSLLGASVVVNGRHADTVAKVAKVCQKWSPKQLKPLEVVADVGKPEDVERLIKTTIEHFGKLDVLVNNAGPYTTTNITQTDLLPIWDETFSVNLRAIVQLTQLAVPHLEKTNGSIVNILADEAMQPIKISLAYSTAKAGLDMLTKILALELGPKHIRVNNVAPGQIQINEHPNPFQMYGAKITPLGRLGQPLDIAKSVAFLSSTDAEFITGITLITDGGILGNMGAMNVFTG
ncbi:unnamed protein product [Medioppia subpectinata]|uniref:Uncharacterized protein n=1 Tax=Medioppia subpectinata TaxID=1979941 RepID=A0A7R9PYY1_9ACAR|nr:unnamed protein product [Medioppia subpectinata]CAG2106406.1 unnamed protein product [Medioppia subpectinata]